MIESLLTFGVPELAMTWYSGIMGVPITFLDKYNPEQFEVLGCSYNYGRPEMWAENTKMSPVISGRNVYKRLFVRYKREL